MRAKVRKLLCETFQRAFKSEHPQFSLLKLPPGNSTKIWVWQAAPNLDFYIVLSPFRNEDAFALEIAWSKTGEFPWTKFGASPTNAPSGRERLSRLWSPHGDEPNWDAAPEIRLASLARLEARSRGEPITYDEDPPLEIVLPRVASLVKDSLAKLKQYALPLFNEVARHHGLNSAPPTDENASF